MVLVAVGGMLAGCATRPPGFLLGEHRDDYGSRHRIDTEQWTHEPSLRYLHLRWDPAGQFLVAQNADSNPADGGRWTRIDWMRLPGDDGWTWAFCLATWDAPSADSAARVTTADRTVPRTGCGGHPFTRMRPAPVGSAETEGDPDA